MTRYDTVKNAMESKRSDNLFIRTECGDLIFECEIDTQKHRILSNEYGEYNGRIECLPIKLDHLMALQNQLTKVILAITVPKEE